MLGFAILMFGMQTMSGAVEPLRTNEVFTNMLTMFSNPLMGILVGILFPCIPKLESLVCRIVKDTEEEMEDESDFDLLDERLVTYPAVAIGQCHRVMAGMAKKVRKNVNRALNLLNDFQPDKYEKVQRKEDLIDKYETKLGMYLMKLTKKEMTSSQTRHVSLYLSTISDFERIGDHAAGIAHMSSEMHEQHTGFSGAAWWSR